MNYYRIAQSIIIFLLTFALSFLVGSQLYSGLVALFNYVR